MSVKHPRRASRAARPEAGFTLVEALVAIVVLVFGLIAVTNLMLVAGTSNRVAGDSTAAANVAQQQLERLRAMDYVTLRGFAGNGPQTETQAVPGAGTVEVTWEVENTVPVDSALIFYTVSAETTNPIARARSRAEYTVFRACTDNRVEHGCP